MPVSSNYSTSDLQKSLIALVEKAKEEIIANHEKAGQVASGRTRASLNVQSQSNADGIEVTLYGRQFFQGLETGRKGGKVPRGFYGIIRQWAIDKGIHFGTQTELNTFSYFVSKKIAEQGTSLYRQGGRSDIYSNVLTELTANVDEVLTQFFDNFVSNMFETSLETIQING